jgi:hypothetical protein
VPIFKIEGDKLRKLGVLPLEKERSLQRLVEQNLGEALGLRFLATEYITTSGGRIDTLAVDEAGSPVIIEYKRNRNDAVVNQALSYLRWLKTQRPEFFEKLMADKLGAEAAGAIGLDWRSPRVICVAGSYSRFDIDTVEIVPLRIELYRYRFYEDGLFLLEPVSTVPEEPVAASKPTSGPVSGEPVEASSLDTLLAKATPSLRQIFLGMREWILALDEAVAEKPTQAYVGYRLANNFAEVHIGRDQLKIHLRDVEYEGPVDMIERMPANYNWTLVCRIYVRTEADVERAKLLERGWV